MLPRWRVRWVKFGHLYRDVHLGQDRLRDDLAFYQGDKPQRNLAFLTDGIHLEHPF
jgi:hypothetical protein